MTIDWIEHFSTTSKIMMRASEGTKMCSSESCEKKEMMLSEKIGSIAGDNREETA